ncbi:hypothetical protein GMMP15_850023 [Candidatus Magnetomoraceae bacterium gMMP-15]
MALKERHEELKKASRLLADSQIIGKKMDNPLIFLCHAKEDVITVRNLHEKLKHAGFNPWLDKVNILPGQDWNYQFQKEIIWALERQTEPMK